MLAKAATGSPKNMAPKLLMATSKASASNGWTWASACRNSTLVEPLGRGALAGRARASGPTGRRRGPTPCAARAGRVARRLPGAAADVEHVVGRRDEPGLVEPLPVAAARRARSGRRARPSGRPPGRPTPPPARRSRWSTRRSLSLRILPLGGTYAPKGRMSMASRAATHHHVLRHPRPARHQAVDDLRAGPADGPGPRAVLAPGREQALRGAQEARRPRPGPGVGRDRSGKRPAHRLHDHAPRAGGRWRPGSRSRAPARSRVRGAGEGVLRRARLEGRPAGDDRPRPARGPTSARARAWRSAAATSTARGRSPSACRGCILVGHVPRRVRRTSRAWADWAAASSSAGPTTSATPSPTWPRSRPWRAADEAYVEDMSGGSPPRPSATTKATSDG